MGSATLGERLLPLHRTPQAPESALLSFDRVSEVKGGRLGWWFRERSRERDERDWEEVGGGGKCGGRRLEAARLRLPGDLPLQGGEACGGEDLLMWTSVNEAEARNGGHPAFLLSLLVWPPPFWVRWRGRLDFPPFLSLLFAPQFPKLI